jgi:DNA-damage-inducible protein J
MYNVSIIKGGLYMAQSTLTIRIDDDIKHDAEILFNKLGFSLSGVINVFFRQAIREQAIPFPIRVKTAEEKYNEYFTPEVIAQIKRSVAQAESGETISFSMDELFAMETGEVPQRALDFLARHKEAHSNA